MPALAFLAVVGLVLVALLFVADATLESGSPIVTSTRVGLPEPWHPNTAGALTTTPAPAPDMSSKAVPSAQPSEALAKIDPAARAARAEAPARQQQPFGSSGYNQRNYPAADMPDRFSARGH
ncbi:MAG: hypothetical protein WA366_22015 [Pseudolabrys sp.]|jgi:hypothetical protein